MCDDSGSDSSDSGGSSNDYSPPSEPSYSPPPEPSYLPPPEPTPEPEPSPTPSTPYSPNPEHRHEDIPNFQHDPEPAYPAEPSEAELFLTDLAAGIIEELMFEESWEEYYDRTGRRYHGKKKSGRGRTRRTSVPGKVNLSTTARDPARSPDLSPASRDTDTVPVIVESKSNTGRNVAIVLSVAASLGILYSFM